MKIGIYIAPFHTIPPEEKNILAPWRLVGEIADGLVQRKHDVYLFAPVGSQSLAQVEAFGIEPVALYKDKLSADDYEKRMISEEKKMFEEAIKFAIDHDLEIIHVHQTKRLFGLIKQVPKLRFVFTIHNPIDKKFQEEIKQLQSLGNCFFVSISDAQRKGLDLNFVDTVYNGINLVNYPFSPDSSDRFLATGRIVPVKGFEDAISAVKSIGAKLLVSGQAYMERDEARDYWERVISPQIDGKQIGYHGNFLQIELISVYQRSRALLFPIKWEEPFGLVMVEAMATGTPVIAYSRGSVPEVVKDGVSGYIVNPSDRDIRGDYKVKKTGILGFTEAVRIINDMKIDDYRKLRQSTRKYIEERFSTEKMVRGYEGVYDKIISI